MKKKPPKKKGKVLPPPRGKSRRLVVAGAVVAATAAALVMQWPGRVLDSRTDLPALLTSGSAEGFNVLVVTLDTTRADRVGCYGHTAARTTAIDALAADGVVFMDAVTAVPMTLPSHSSIFTGLYPPNHGVRDNGEYKLSPEHVTLAEILKARGYDTAAFVSAFVLDGRYGLGQGFDVYNDAVDPRKSIALAEVINERPATTVTDAALQWLGAHDGNRPFFMWVHYFDPHQPYKAPEPFASEMAGRPYDAEIAYVDSQISRLLGAVEQRGQKDRTLYIVIADHGESLGEHDEQTHGMFIYDAVMKVPLVLSCPGVFHGPHVIDDVVVSTVDVFPTVLDLLGISDGPAGDGVSLLEAPANRDRVAYMESMTPYLDNGWAPLFGLRGHQDKYILAPRPEYYDLRDDPQELNNLYRSSAISTGKARDRLVAGLEAMLAQWPSVEEAARAAVPMDAESLARLEALGYVGGTTPDPDAEQADPKDMMPVMTKINMARGLFDMGRYEEALASIREAQAASPGSVTVRMQTARLFLTLGRTEEAEEALRAVIAVKPQTQALVLLAQIMIADRRFDDADALLRQALKMDPRYGPVFVAHGDLAAAKGRLREANGSYLHALKVDPYRSGPTVQMRLQTLRDYMDKIRERRGNSEG